MITLELLQNCVDNNDSLFRIIECKNYKLIIEKYQFVPKFDIRVINLSGKHVINWYQHLGPFDTFDLIRELLSPLNVRIAGKTDNAQIPKNLLKHMQEKYPDDKVLASLGLKNFIPVEEWAEHKWVNANGNPDPSIIPTMYTIYGEGYGEGIQSGGWYIKGGNEFIVFDVKVNDIYLLTTARDEIANKLGAPIVPFIGYFTLDEAIEFVRKGFRSVVAENPDVKMAEGLVLRTDLGLRNRMGKRLIAKVKYEDFQKYRNVYGTDEKVEQPKNENYVK